MATEIEISTDTPTHPLFQQLCDALKEAAKWAPPPSNAQVDAALYVESWAEFATEFAAAVGNLRQLYGGLGIDGTVAAWMEKFAEGLAAVADSQNAAVRAVIEALEEDLRRAQNPTGLDKLSNV